jgi:DNA-binding GntR family transcriptional regulator
MSGAKPRGTYLKVADELDRRLADGLYTGGLPSEQSLRSEFGVARSTVRRALAVLVGRGRIYVDPGVGWKAVGSPHRPSHQAVADGVTGRILAGDLAPGDRLPSEAQLAQEHGVARVAVRRALLMLRSDGVLRSRQGAGWFVA